MRRFWVAAAGALLAASCSPGEGPKSIPLPTSETTLAPEPPPSTDAPETSSTTTSTTTTTTEVPPRYRATLRRTTDGVPHVLADDRPGLWFGQGWASAEDHGCTLIDQVLKVFGERAANLGPGVDGENIESDFAWRAIGLAEIAADDFDVASDDVVEMFTGFTAGWNDYLASVAGEGLSGWCGEADWVRPLQPVEVYTYARSLALLASSAQMVDYLPGAEPPATASTAGVRAPGAAADDGLDPAADPFAVDPSAVETSAVDPSAVDPVASEPGLDLSAVDLSGLDLEALDLGSNGWAIGRERTAGGSGGMLVGNPHFPWEGELRWAEVHLNIPGEIDMYGAQLLGVPGVGIGFNRGVAWTHTVSAGKRMTAYRLALDPASPTSYLVDGESRPMTSMDRTIEILRPDGTLDTETRTLWRSEYGPIIDFPGIGWTDATTLTFRDANLDNDEFIEQYAALLEVDTLKGLIDVNEEHQGDPLFNTVATGADGVVWYADPSATPNLSDEAEQIFRQQLTDDPLTALAWDNGVALLDGSDSRFEWVNAPGARDPGLIPFDGIPQVLRDDYVFNANDSYWVPSDEFLLEGDYSILQGETKTPLSMRTRRNAAVLSAENRARLAGEDGLFDLEELRNAVFENTGEMAVLLRRHAVDACRAAPMVDLPELLDEDGNVVFEAATVDLTEACGVLARWRGRYNLGSVGAVLWRATMTRFDEAQRTSTGPLFGDPFDPADPTRTPSRPADDPTPLLQAMARATQTIEAAGFDLATTLGAAQFTERSGDRVPLHGGTNVDGVTNIVSWSNSSTSTEVAPTRGEPVAPGALLRGAGYPVNFGTSYVFTVALGEGAPRAWALLTYGQTGDRDSPLFESQTIRFSEKNWRRVAYTENQIAEDPQLTEVLVEGN